MTTFRDIVGGINVFLVAIIALAISAVAAICFLVTADVLSPADVGPQGWLRDQLVELDGLTGTDRTIAIVVSAAAFGTGLLLLIFESIPALFPSRLYGTDASGHTVLIDRRTIKQMVENVAVNTENVTSATARLRNTGSGLQARVKATLAPGSNISDTGRAVESKIKDDLRDLAGVSVSSVRLEFEYGKTPAEERTSDRTHPRPV
jgi:uncharacterized alkaline shock family protein YloU